MAFFNRSHPTVKPVRNTRRPNRPFGEGIFPQRQRPLPTAPYTDADSQWWAAQNRGSRYDRAEPLVLPPVSGGAPAGPDYDALYRERRLQDRLERGLCM